jgi:integrase
MEAKRREQEQRRTSFEEYATAYVQTHRKADGSELEGSSRRKLEEYLAHLLDAFRGEMISSISSEDIARWLNSAHIGQYPLKRSYQLLKAIMGRAVSEGLIDRNPCTMKAPRLPKSKQAQIPPATADELRIMYEAMPEKVRVMVYLGAVFDMRIGEMCALQRRDIDLKRGVLHIRRSYDYTTKGVKGTKNESSTADQPIPDRVKPYLVEALRQIPDTLDAQLMPAREGHNRPMPPAKLRYWFDKAKIVAGRPDLHPHTLRKTAISAAARSGATLKETMKYGRHSDVATSVGRYQDAGTDERQREIADDVANRIMPSARSRDEIENDIEKTKRRLAQLEQELSQIDG